MRLNELSDNPGAQKKRKRVGRGIGSGIGKTSGKGHKGQNARSGKGKNIAGFEGGQTPLYRRMPKRGFNNYNSKSYDLINLNKLQAFIDSKRIDSSKELTELYLREAGIVSNKGVGICILGNGDIKSSINIKVSKISSAASEKIKQAGGSVTLI